MAAERPICEEYTGGDVVLVSHGTSGNHGSSVHGNRGVEPSSHGLITWQLRAPQLSSHYLMLLPMSPKHWMAKNKSACIHTHAGMYVSNAYGPLEQSRGLSPLE